MFLILFHLSFQFSFKLFCFDFIHSFVGPSVLCFFYHGGLLVLLDSLLAFSRSYFLNIFEYSPINGNMLADQALELITQIESASDAKNLFHLSLSLFLSFSFSLFLPVEQVASCEFHFNCSFHLLSKV